MMDDEDAEPAGRPLFLFGVFGAVVCALLGMFGPHDGAVWKLPQVLEQRAATALLLSGHSGLDVRADGQRLILRGLVEDERDIAASRLAALTSSGQGGPWAGGVTQIDVTGVSVGVFERPYVWSVRREAQRLVLSGAVPSEGAKADLLAQAADAFPSLERIDQMRVAGGAPSPDFARTAREAIRLLAGLNTGEARIVDDQIAIIGDGNQAGVDAMRAVFAAPPAPYRSRLALTVDGLDLENPELQGLNLASGDAETCERAFSRLLDGKTINFETGSAAISPSSRQLLDSLATVALRCDRYSIEVSGHTDNQGSRELNMALSQQRADAVAAYLAGQGVARERLTARGYGPDRPRVSNATEAGQAANRRIDFNVGGEP